MGKEVAEKNVLNFIEPKYLENSLSSLAKLRALARFSASAIDS